ncbi:hypothetical protein [Deinococcus sp. Arct2-2]|uniref:hypothetical protein n=1 Tax=Deinococcus sp. Arct2-2 TaxID=2568653 RepID=UPI001F1062D2|nr:hypothetical protein [Deinococcus sp. Arct2-2]
MSGELDREALLQLLAEQAAQITRLIKRESKQATQIQQLIEENARLKKRVEQLERQVKRYVAPHSREAPKVICQGFGGGSVRDGDLLFEGYWGSVAGRGVTTAAGVKHLNPLKNLCSCLGTTPLRFAQTQLCLQRREKAFLDGVIPAFSFLTHALNSMQSV